ncbi:hypothetical protein EPO33_01895 [Patescibacteria group bacterium]|nr:MAG: hypothetical protein EPO33_01895 [Patescibacteria group bacterium]
MTIAIRRSPLIIAADQMGRSDILRLAHALRDLKLGGWKLGSVLFRKGCGPEMLGWMKTETGGGRIFADTKIHNTPDVMKETAAYLAEAGADMMTVMAASGIAGIRAACDGAPEEVDIYVVGVLTTMEEDDCSLVFDRRPNEQQHRFFLLTEKAFKGLKDPRRPCLICSPQDLDLVKIVSWTQKPNTATPGVRSPGADPHDQYRIGTPAHAVASGATNIIMGRQITQAKDPVGAVKNIYEEIGFDWTR